MGLRQDKVVKGVPDTGGGEGKEEGGVAGAEELNALRVWCVCVSVCVCVYKRESA